MPKNRDFPVEFQVRAGKIPKIVGRIPYNSRSEFMGFFEILRPGCFTRAIKKAKKILSLWNHDSSKPLANSANGSLVLKDSPTALYVEIKPDPTISWAADAIKAVRRGDLGGLSFGFSLPADGSGVEYNGDVREITEVDKLFEVSPCVFPSYSESSVALRNNKTRKRGKKMSKYSLAEIRRITKEMESAEGADLIDLGAEYDEIAPVVLPDSPLFSEVGYRGITAFWASLQGINTELRSTARTPGVRPGAVLSSPLVSSWLRSVTPDPLVVKQIRGFLRSGRQAVYQRVRLQMADFSCRIISQLKSCKPHGTTTRS